MTTIRRSSQLAVLENTTLHPASHLQMAANRPRVERMSSSLVRGLIVHQPQNRTSAQLCAGHCGKTISGESCGARRKILRGCSLTSEGDNAELRRRNHLPPLIGFQYALSVLGKLDSPGDREPNPRNPVGPKREPKFQSSSPTSELKTPVAKVDFALSRCGIREVFWRHRKGTS